MSKGAVLSICDRTGVMVEPWLEAGYECWIVDIQHPTGIHRDGRLVRVGADVRRWLPPRISYAIGFAFPPCTDQAVSGARWFKEKGLAGLAGAVELVEASRNVLEWINAPWMLENPVGTISNYWRKPDFWVHPWQFAGWNEDVQRENYTKKQVSGSETASAARVRKKLPNLIEQTSFSCRGPLTAGTGAA